LILTVGEISIVYDAAKVGMIQFFYVNLIEYSHEFKKALIFI